MNDRGGRISYNDFVEIVEEVAGEPLDGWIDDHFRTPDPDPNIPNDQSMFKDRDRFNLDLPRQFYDKQLECNPPNKRG